MRADALNTVWRQFGLLLGNEIRQSLSYCPLADVHSYLSVVSIVYFADNVFRVIRSRQNVLVLG